MTDKAEVGLVIIASLVLLATGIIHFWGYWALALLIGALGLAWGIRNAD